MACSYRDWCIVLVLSGWQVSLPQKNCEAFKILLSVYFCYFTPQIQPSMRLYLKHPSVIYQWVGVRNGSL